MFGWFLNIDTFYVTVHCPYLLGHCGCSALTYVLKFFMTEVPVIISPLIYSSDHWTGFYMIGTSRHERVKSFQNTTVYTGKSFEQKFLLPSFELSCQKFKQLFESSFKKAATICTISNIPEFFQENCVVNEILKVD